MPGSETPPPGSDEAIDRGCTCPVVDNGHGRGRFGDGDMYVYRPDCPVHEPKDGDDNE